MAVSLRIPAVVGFAGRRCQSKRRATAFLLLLWGIVYFVAQLPSRSTTADPAWWQDLLFFVGLGHCCLPAQFIENLGVSENSILWSPSVFAVLAGIYWTCILGCHLVFLRYGTWFTYCFLVAVLLMSAFGYSGIEID